MRRQTAGGWVNISYHWDWDENGDRQGFQSHILLLEGKGMAAIGRWSANGGKWGNKRA